MRDQSEAEDWAAVVRGDAQAFGRIFDLHQAQVFRHSRRLVDDLEDARDVVATTFLEAWRRRSSVRVVNGSVAPWLIVTATNVSRNLVRARRRYRSMLSELPLPTHDSGADIELHGELTVALASLPIDQQRVVALCLMEGFSEAAAAAALHIPPGTVKSRLARARESMRHILSTSSVSGHAPLESI
ncbi:MAG TPA: RNA polymerase sigma factor [Microbacterium sp.]|nr:RNA polymerase sigma factor [Microbacterium sp.]